jgi:hypothetical protein
VPDVKHGEFEKVTLPESTGNPLESAPASTIVAEIVVDAPVTDVNVPFQVPANDSTCWPVVVNLAVEDSGRNPQVNGVLDASPCNVVRLAETIALREKYSVPGGIAPAGMSVS